MLWQVQYWLCEKTLLFFKDLLIYVANAYELVTYKHINLSISNKKKNHCVWIFLTDMKLEYKNVSEIQKFIKQI